MSVRISQYETGARIPGEDMILKLADALHCNYKAISDYSLGAAEDIIETLFWLEESATSLPARGKGTRFPEYTAPGNLIHLTTMTPAKSSEAARPTYNEDDYDSTGSPVALTFEYGLVNDFLSEWCEMKTKLNNGEISPNEYFEWKITWPHAQNKLANAHFTRLCELLKCFEATFLIVFWGKTFILSTGFGSPNPDTDFLATP